MTWNIPYTDVENGYYRLAFKPAIHITDTLILLDSDDQLIAPDSLSPAALIAKYKASGYKAKVKGGYVLPLTGDQHKNYTWSFRYTNPGKGATTTTEGVDNEFLIESNVFPYGDKAQAIAPEHGHGANVPYGSYQLLGNMTIQYAYPKSAGDADSYVRTLSLDNAIATTSFHKGNVIYGRESFTSFSDDIGVIHLTADVDRMLNFTLGMNRPEHYKTTTVGNDLLMEGELPDGVDTLGLSGTKYMSRVRILLPKGGSIIPHVLEHISTALIIYPALFSIKMI